MDQIEIFKNRSLNKYKLLNPQRYPKIKWIISKKLIVQERKNRI